MSKNYIAYTFLTLAALFWSGNFIIGKFATLFEVPPLTLNFFRWVMVWFILIPFTIKEILAKRNYIKENFLVISPDECIDCGLCEPECPVDAIFSEDELPADQIKFIEINEQLSKEWPNITQKKDALSQADKYKNQKDKFNLLKR